MKKIRNNITKSLALFLIATLLFVGLPTQGLILNANADTEANPQVNVSEMDSITYTEDNDVYILAEDVSKRGEFEKHYLCSDGNFIAVAYPEAIHRLDENGQWVDLDFSLVLNTSAHAYESQNGDFRVAFCSGISATSDASVMSSSVTQTQNTDLISLQNGIYSLSWGLYANMAMTNPISSSAMQSSGISSTSETASLPATLNTIQINGNVAGVESTAAISDMENKSIYDTDTFDLSKVSNSVEYHSVFGADEGISLRYTVSYNKIEEDIILTKATNVTSFSLSVDADGLVPMLNQDNSVDFLDENGDMVYHIGIPYMVDAAFAVLNDIQVTVNTDSANTNGRWLITYTQNNEWLQAEERVYPIMLDPSITTNEYQSYIEDTYVEENSTVDHSDEQYLYITKNGNNRREAVVRITKLPTIEASMPIVSATLHMVAQYGPFSTLSMKSVYGATFGDISECAYGDSAFMDEPITSTGLLSASDTGLTFDISNCISRMYDDEQEAQASGSPYYGDFIIGFYDADDSNFCYPFLSTEYATVSSRPTFTVKYGYTLPADMEEGEVFSFESVYSYSFMTVNGSNPANNSNIYQVDNGNEIAITTQQFKLERVSSTGGYLLRSMSSSNGTDKVVSVQRGSSSVSSGQNVCLASATDALAQEWFIVPVDYNEYRIVPRANMSLALTVYGIADGSNSGRTTTSEGNIFVQTLNTNSYQQLWYIYDSENHAVETDDCRSTLETDEYYITNKYVGKYLHRTGNTVDCKQGTINDLNAQEETIKWKIVNLGDGYCTIQRYDRPDLYMVPESTSSGSGITFRIASDTSLPDKFKWSIRIATGGGCLIQNKESKLYLYAFEQSANPSLVRSYGLYSAGSVGYKKQVWRFVSADDYIELDNRVTFNDIVMDVSETQIASINKNPSGAYWSAYTDFDYSIVSGSQYVSYNAATKKFTGIIPGVATINAIHTVTNISCTFEITVNCPTVVIPCTFAKAASYSTIKNFAISITPYLEDYSAYLNGATWRAYGNGVANFNLQDMTVTGVSTGLAWLEAIKNNDTILTCFVYVEDILKNFSPEIQDYLYIDGSWIGTVSCHEYENNPSIDPYILRTEWYLYAVKMDIQGKSCEEIRVGLNQQFGLSIENGYLFQLFINDVFLGSRGGYSRENIRLSFDGLRCLFNFFWFQYAAYCITTLDTVNVYTPATVQDVIDEKAFARSLGKESKVKTEEILDSFTQHGNASSIVIGTTYENKTWHEVGESIGASYFYNPDYDSIYATNPYEVKAANHQFVQNALAQNKNIYCSHNPELYFQLSTNRVLIDNSYGNELKEIYAYCLYNNLTMSYGAPEYINGQEVWQIIISLK